MNLENAPQDTQEVQPENVGDIEREIHEAANAEMQVHGEIVAQNNPQPVEQLHSVSHAEQPVAPDYTYNDLHSDTQLHSYSQPPTVSAVANVQMQNNAENSNLHSNQSLHSDQEKVYKVKVSFASIFLFVGCRKRNKINIFAF